MTCRNFYLNPDFWMLFIVVMLITNNKENVRYLFYTVEGIPKSVKFGPNESIEVPDLQSEDQIIFNSLDYKLRSMNERLGTDFEVDFTTGSDSTLFCNTSNILFENTLASGYSESQSIIVSGNNLTSNIILTAPNGFIINLDDSTTNQSPITLTQSNGIVSSTTIYVVFAPTVEQVYNGSLSISSVGADSIGVSISGTAVGYDTDAQAYFSRIATLGQTQPSDAQKEIYNDFFVTSKTYNGYDNLSKIIRFWTLASEVKQNGWISLVNPSSTIITESASAPSWTQFEGTSGGTGRYLDTHFIPSTDGGTIFLQNNASIIVYCRTNSIDELAILGGYSFTPSLNITSLYPYGSGGASYTLNDISGNGGLPSGIRSNGSLIITRNNNDICYYIDGILFISGTSVTTGLIPVSFHIHGRNGDGVNMDNSSRQIAMVGFGRGDIKPWYMNYAMEQYMDAINKGTPLVSEKRINILVAGQSNNTPMYDIAGHLSSPYTDVLPNVYTGMGAVSTNPFTHPLSGFQVGYNTSAYDSGLGTHYWWGVFLAYKLANTYGRKVSITNPSILSSSLSKTLGPVVCWDSTEVGELYDTTRASYFLPSIYKNNPLSETIMIWNQGNADADNLAAATAYQDNLIALIAKWRSPIDEGGLGLPNMKVFIVPFYSGYIYPYASIVRAAHDYVIANIPHCYALSIDDIGQFITGDEAHWDYPMLQTFGEMAADIIDARCN